MIVFDLICTEGHTFEGWFHDSSSYREQKRKDLIACPICNSTAVEKLPSTFAIKSSTGGSKPVPAEAITDLDPAKVSQLQEKVSEFVQDHFEDVGCNFTKEALKIHYGVTEPRNIRGVSTREEEKVLDKEGVEYFKVPLPTPTESDG